VHQCLVDRGVRYTAQALKLSTTLLYDQPLNSCEFGQIRNSQAHAFIRPSVSQPVQGVQRTARRLATRYFGAVYTALGKVFSLLRYSGYMVSGPPSVTS
jgi:hypothetical protein